MNVVIALTSAIAATQSAPPTDAQMDAFIEQRVRAEQANMPRDVGRGFTFTSVTYADREMRYVVEVTQMDADELRESVPAMVPASCATARPYVERGVTYRYTYVIPSTGYIETLLLNRAVCSF